MHKRTLIVIALFFAVSFSIFLSSIAIAQNESAPADPCAGVTCNPTTTTCPDSYLASCTNTCSGGVCSTCVPSCSGHEAPADPCAGITCNPATTTCPDSYVASCSNTCSAGACSSCTPSCAGHEAPAPITNVTPPACPTPPEKPPCPADAYPKAEYDSKGCITGYKCEPVKVACPPISTPLCAPGYTVVTKTDAAGCTIYDCEPVKVACPLDAKLCPDGKTYVGRSGPNCEFAPCPEINETLCAQVITPAMDAAGNCREFPNSCLPPGWYRVDKCPEKKAVCGNNICEEGEANIPGGCPPGSDPGCLGPPSYAGTCPGDCRTICPTFYSPVCGTDGKTYSNDCFAKASGAGVAYRGECGAPKKEFCGNNICEAGEENYCSQDCISARPECPLKQTCADGSTVSCRIGDYGKCICDPCREQVPQGCRQEIDKERGFVRVVCETERVCPQISIPQDARQRCEEKGGRFEIRKDYSGCEFPDCTFGAVSVTPVPVFNPLEPEKKCTTETDEQRETTKQNCEKLGLNFVISVQGGCKVSKCSSKPQKRGCEPLPGDERRRIEEECMQRGLGVVKDFDESGCPAMRCGEQSQCPRELPREAYEKCGREGGELVVRRDSSGCVSFSQCLIKGDIRETDVDPIEEVPDPAELLSLAFRMEELKIQLDKLAKKTDDIANYYASTKSADEGRYRRVSDMFEAAKEKVDEIKSKLRSIVDRGVTKDDLIEIKRDIKYIKNVMMKDILYLMLSSSDDVKEIKASRAVKRGDRFEEVKATDETNCGSDGSCFDRGFRLCKKLIFYPEGSRGPRVEVQGLVGNVCIMYAVLPEGEGPPAGTMPGINPPYDMTCKIEKYALGVRTPEEDIFPYCEGSMVELMKKFGGPGGKGPPGVPGKCSGEECKDYCGRGPEEAKECLEHLGPYLPPEAKQGLERLARGEGFGGFGRPQPQPSGEFREEFREEGFREEFSTPPSPPGFREEFNRPQPRGEFSEGEFREESRQPASAQPCGDGFCDDFEQRNPDACPRDCQSIATSVSTGTAPSAAGEQCSGCLNNNICDPGECSFCQDCQRR